MEWLSSEKQPPCLHKPQCQTPAVKWTCIYKREVELEIAGITVTAAESIDSRIRAVFITRGARGAETTWLDLTVPVDAFPIRLFDRLHTAGWQIPGDALVVAEPATEIDEERDSAGRVVAWKRRDCRYQQATFPLVSTGPRGEEQPPSPAAIKEARNALRHFGINRAPNLTQTWRDVI